MDTIVNKRPRVLAFRPPAINPQIKAEADITEFSRFWLSEVLDRKIQHKDTVLKMALEKLTELPASFPMLLLLASNKIDRRIENSKRSDKVFHIDALKRVSMDLHFRSGAIAETKGQLNIAAREYWAAGMETEVTRIYTVWAAVNRSSGNFQDASKLEAMLIRGSNPLKELAKTRR